MIPKSRIQSHQGKKSIWNKENRFSGTNFHTNWCNSTEAINQKQIGKSQFPRSKKALQRYIGFLIYYQK